MKTYEGYNIYLKIYDTRLFRQKMLLSKEHLLSAAKFVVVVMNMPRFFDVSRLKNPCRSHAESNHG